MPDSAVITFAALELERDDLFVFALLDHFGRDLAFAVGDLFSIDMHQHFEGGRFTRRDVEKIDIYRVAFCNAILPATRLDNCVSHTKENFLGEKPRKFTHNRGFDKQKAVAATRARFAERNGYRPEISSTISPFGGCAV